MKLLFALNGRGEEDAPPREYPPREDDEYERPRDGLDERERESCRESEDDPPVVIVYIVYVYCRL